MSETYREDSVFWTYLKWHYGKGLRELIGVGGNLLWFVSNFFSLRLMTATLFSPWRRIARSYGVRLVGFAIRAIVIAIGTCSYVALLIFIGSVFFIWLAAPLILMGSIILSTTFFIV